jgi:hypothetical protein
MSQAHLIGPINSGVSAGGAGASTNNKTSTEPIIGELLGVFIGYNHAPPAGTTDVILKTVGTAPWPGTVTFLTVSNNATSGWYRPMLQGCDASAGAIAGAYEPILLADFVNVKIDQANDGDSVDVWFLVR